MKNWNQILEDAIIGKVVTALIDDGYRVQLSDQDGGGLFVYAIADGGQEIPEGGYKHWVRLVLGNGADVIVDYTTNLEDTLKEANAFAAEYMQ